MTKKIIAIFMFSFVSFSAFAQVDAASGSMRRTAVRYQSSGFHVDLGLSTGLMSFQDIQVPQSAFSLGRSDGSPASIDNGSHMGLPFAVNAVASYRLKPMTPRFTLGGLHASSMMSSKNSANASYSRLEAGPGVEFVIGKHYLTGPKIGADVLYRRSMFGNSSGGHVIESIMPRGSLTYTAANSRWTVGGFAGFSVNSNFKYDQKNLLRGKTVQGSSASVFEWGALSQIGLTRTTAVDLGFSQESAQVAIDNVSKYSEFGLAVSEFDESKRNYNLKTTIYKLGYHRTF